MKKFFITTPIYYPNARPHVGSAYTTIACDAIARYKRMCGYDVAFLTGTDEHGEKLARAAEAAGKSPADFVAEKRELFKNLWRTLGIPQYSPKNPAGYRFVHTSQNPDHVKSVQWMIRQAKKAGYIEKKKYQGRYCVHDERYVSDSSEPVNCDICGRPAELISEDNYFFKLSAFQEKLLKLYDEHSEFVLPDFRMNEVKSFVKSGLRDISISRRRLKWGIPWPDDNEQVVYVWYDALTSYLTGIGFRGSDKPEAGFEKYWMDREAERVHMIGKDILRFHAVYWPAFLMAAGLPLPKTIFAHGWIYYEQDKMSKSKGNVIYPEPIVEALDSFGAPGNDALRYYLLCDTRLGSDASFSYDGLTQRYNSDLANDLGNLASRSITMLHQFCDGVVPPRPAPSMAGPYWDIEGLYQFFREEFNRMNLADALAGVRIRISDTNRYINDNKPWERAKSSSQADRAILDGTLYNAADLLRAAAVLLFPVVPSGAARLWGRIGRTDLPEEQNILQLRRGDLAPGTRVGKAEPIFPRLDKEKTIARLTELAEADREREQVVATVNPPAGGLTVGSSSESKAHGQESSDRGYPYDRRPVGQSTTKGTTVEEQPEKKLEPPAVPPAPAPAGGGAASAASDQKISIEDFVKVEMRVGEVIGAERIPKADKLLKLQVDIGTEVRQVVAGIAEHYAPEKLVGMKVVVVTNLAPRKLRGVESNGMIVAASVETDGRPVLATFVDEVPKGARLK